MAVIHAGLWAHFEKEVQYERRVDSNLRMTRRLRQEQ